MTRLRDFSWWPNAWTSEKGGSHSPIEIRKKGLLKNVRRIGNELTLILECDGVIFTATIGSHLSEDFLILLRHILLQHWGEPISAVEEFEVDFGHLT
jgi:hypothetical protein